MLALRLHMATPSLVVQGAGLSNLRVSLNSSCKCANVPDGVGKLPAGFLGFYSGMRAKIVQSILAAALLMAIKEELTASMRKALQAPISVRAAVR